MVTLRKLSAFPLHLGLIPTRVTWVRSIEELLVLSYNQVVSSNLFLKFYHLPEPQSLCIMSPKVTSYTRYLINKQIQDYPHRVTIGYSMVVNMSFYLCAS